MTSMTMLNVERLSVRQRSSVHHVCTNWEIRRPNAGVKRQIVMTTVICIDLYILVVLGYPMEDTAEDGQ